MPRPASGEAPSLDYRGGRFAPGLRRVPAEVAVAISVEGSTHAVMMATPADLRDLAFGLALNERIVSSLSEIERFEIAETELGIDCRLWLSPERAARHVTRRRMMTGPVGCGLCGVESLELAARELPKVPAGVRIEPDAIGAAVAEMAVRQMLSHETRAVHAAGFHRIGAAPVVREDVGRHNALDKVAGHLAQAGIDPASGFLTITSRVSVELVQKAAAMGCGLIAAVSAPTGLAIEAAQAAGITLVAVARGADFEIFTRPDRVRGATDGEGVADDAA